VGSCEHWNELSGSKQAGKEDSCYMDLFRYELTQDL
jgi:hypothetical protein